MKKTAAIFAMFSMMLFTVINCKAQDKGNFKNSTPEQRAEMQTKWLKTKLELNEEQTTKVSAINLKYAKEMEPVIKGEGGKLARFKKAKSINDKKEAEYKPVFTTEQYEKYQKIKAEMRDEMKERMQERKN